MRYYLLCEAKMRARNPWPAQQTNIKEASMSEDTVKTATGTDLGGLLAAAIARRHSAQVQEQLHRGGLVLWVSVADAEAEKRALAVLDKMAARDIHVHEINRESLREIPRLLGAIPRLLA